MQSYTNLILDNLAGTTPKEKFDNLELMKHALEFWLLTFDESKGNQHSLACECGCGKRFRPYNQLEKTKLALGITKEWGGESITN